MSKCIDCEKELTEDEVYEIQEVWVLQEPANDISREDGEITTPLCEPCVDKRMGIKNET